MRLRLTLLAVLLMLGVHSIAVAADPNDPVIVTTPPIAMGDISVPAGREIAGLEQAYVEEEYFISGEADVYTYNEIPVPGEIIVRDPNEPYTTRILIRRPADPNEFNGTVVVEWLNSTAGFDTSPVWHASAEYFAREGVVYVGVTNSTTSINYLVNGCLLLGVLPPATCGTRYAGLSMTENGVAFEMASQIAHLLKTSAAPNPLHPDYPVQRLYHAGQSQQGGSMITYATAFHFPDNDGYFVQANGSARPINFGTACEAVGAPAYPDCTPTLQGDDLRVATDLPVPVYRVHTETDLYVGLGSPGARQTDTPTFRYYETAGTGHVTIHTGEALIPAGVLGLTDPLFLEEICVEAPNTIADGPVFGSYLYNAMWQAMEDQVQSGTVPPTGDLFAVDPNDQILRDVHGNVIGGIRLPQMDLPIATYAPQNSLDPSVPPILNSLGGLFCVLTATSEPFDDATVAALYPDRELFVADFNQKIDDLLAARFLLPEDAAKLRLFVESKDQAKCINALNKDFGKVAKAQGKEICKCIKDFAKEKNGSAVACIAADADQKVAKVLSKTVLDETKNCTVETPDFGPTSATAINDAAVQKELDLFEDLFGTDLDAAIVLESALLGKDKSKCQLATAKALKKCQLTKLKEFNKCKKEGLKAATVHDAVTLGACIGKDAKGKIAKACDTKLFGTMIKKCLDKGQDYASLFPGICVGEASWGDFHGCIEARVECRVCLALNAADGSKRNCDQFDDGLFNATCP